MKPEWILERLEAGDVETVKQKLKEEIYTASLDKKSGVRQRYAAMKKYFTYRTGDPDSYLKRPGAVEWHGEKWFSFLNGYSAVLTKESCEGFDFITDGNYPDVANLMKPEALRKAKLDMRKMFAEAKAAGYKLKGKEVDGNDFTYLMELGEAVYKIGLLDATYSIIDDGEAPTVYYNPTNPKAPIYLENNIGICIVMPVRPTSWDGKIIIRTEEM